MATVLGSSGVDVEISWEILLGWKRERGTGVSRWVYVKMFSE
jgi:hypothetical protein